MTETRPSILIVDDEPEIVGLIEEYLTSLDYGCTSSTDPDRAIQHLKESKFDLVITDLKMGATSGMDVLHAARGSEDSDTLVVLMTAFPTVENAIEAMLSGVDNFILKPFSLETLKHVVKGSLDKQRLARENVSLKESLALYRASEALEAPLELAEYLEMVLEVAVGELGGSIACLAIFEGPPEKRKLQQLIKRGRELEGLTLDEKEMLHVADRVVEKQGVFTSPQHKGQGPLLALALRAGGDMVGLLAVMRGMNEPAFTKAQTRALAIIGSGAAVAIKNARLYNTLQEQYLGAIRALVAAVEAKDPYTSGHSEKVGLYGQMLAREIGAGEGIVDGMRVAGLLHDAGKIGIPESILLKKGGLTEEEYEVIKGHVAMSERIVEPLPLPESVLLAISEHHERLDGSGYPRGLSGESISIPGRIIAVVDVFDAMTSDRIYRSRMTVDDAFTALDSLVETGGLDREIVGGLKRIVNMKDREEFEVEGN